MVVGLIPLTARRLPDRPRGQPDNRLGSSNSNLITAVTASNLLPASNIRASLRIRVGHRRDRDSILPPVRPRANQASPASSTHPMVVLPEAHRVRHMVSSPEPRMASLLSQGRLTDSNPQLLHMDNNPRLLRTDNSLLQAHPTDSNLNTDNNPHMASHSRHTAHQ